MFGEDDHGCSIFQNIPVLQAIFDVFIINGRGLILFLFQNLIWYCSVEQFIPARSCMLSNAVSALKGDHYGSGTDLASIPVNYCLGKNI